MKLIKKLSLILLSFFMILSYLPIQVIDAEGVNTDHPISVSFNETDIDETTKQITIKATSTKSDVDIIAIVNPDNEETSGDTANYQVKENTTLNFKVKYQQLTTTTSFEAPFTYEVKSFETKKTSTFFIKKGTTYTNGG